MHSYGTRMTIPFAYINYDYTESEYINLTLLIRFICLNSSEDILARLFRNLIHHTNIPIIKLTRIVPIDKLNK